MTMCEVRVRACVRTRASERVPDQLYGTLPPLERGPGSNVQAQASAETHLDVARLFSCTSLKGSFVCIALEKVDSKTSACFQNDYSLMKCEMSCSSL